MTTPLIDTIARAMLTVDYAESEQKHPGMTAEALDDDYTLRDYRAQAQAALTAITEAGMVIVPREPADAMIKAILDVHIESFGDYCTPTPWNAYDTYRAMICTPLDTKEGE